MIRPVTPQGNDEIIFYKGSLFFHVVKEYGKSGLIL